MNKNEMISRVVEVLAERDDAVVVTKKAMGLYVDTILDTIVEAVASGDSVKLAGFGSFEPVERAARIGINPQNPSEKINIPATVVPKFRAASAFKTAVKGE